MPEGATGTDAKGKQLCDEDPPRSPDVKRRNRDDAPRSTRMRKRRRRDNLLRLSRDGESKTPATGGEFKNQDVKTSGSARSEAREQPDRCDAQAQQQLPVAAIARPRALSLDGRPQEYTESFEEAELRRRETKGKREEARREMDKVAQTVYFNDPYKVMQTRPSYTESFVCKQKASDGILCTRTGPTVQASRPTGEIKFGSGDSILRHGERSVIKKEDESGERVQATAPPAPGTNPHDPVAPQDPLRAALAVARQAITRREQQNVYQRQREEARREMDKVVQTVYFNDTYISPFDFMR